ncbi:MAG: hypothetical protein ACE5J7_03175 [Candidatus Aenigmatarchaeota archaeon]
MPTLNKALEEELKRYNLSWKDIEKVIAQHKGKTKVLSRKKAKNIFIKGKIVNSEEKLGKKERLDPNDNMPFYAYTKDRIFYIGISGELGECWVDSIPRNPSKREQPKYLP